LAGNLNAYILLNQMLLHDHSSQELRDMPGSLPWLKLQRPRNCNTPGKVDEFDFKLTVGRVMHHLSSVCDYRVNKEGMAFDTFRKKMLHPSSRFPKATADDVYTFCKDVLFPPLVLGAYIYTFSMRRHRKANDKKGQDSKEEHETSVSEVKTQGKGGGEEIEEEEGWQALAMDMWPIKRLVRHLLSHLGGDDARLEDEDYGLYDRSHGDAW
jgi:hypothetical protein